MSVHVSVWVCVWACISIDSCQAAFSGSIIAINSNTLDEIEIVYWLFVLKNASYVLLASRMLFSILFRIEKLSVSLAIIHGIA